MSIKELEEAERRLKEADGARKKKKPEVSKFLAEIPLNYIIHVMTFIVIICVVFLLWISDRNARNDVRDRLAERVSVVERLEAEDDLRVRILIHELIKPEAFKQINK